MKNRLKEIRKSKGLTQTALAEVIGTSLRNIQYIEKGERGIEEWLDKLSEALECQPYELIAPDDESVFSFQQRLLKSIPNIEQASRFVSAVLKALRGMNPDARAKAEYMLREALEETRNEDVKKDII